jgi:hypothetical protein
MAFRINDIITNLKGGGARPNLFQVELTSPFDADLNSIAPFMVQSSSIPASTISPIEIPYFGRRIKIAGDRTFENWSVNVMNDENFKVRHYMERWHNAINSLSQNINLTGTPSPSAYKSTALVKQYGKTNPNTPIRTYKINNIFPLQISGIDLAWAEENAIETFQVTFAYDWFEVLPGPTGSVQ